ncbi:MAG: hypothetical protein J6I50_09745 [Clostridia bacterium]|nr:hypothetical protein [Clostridia bacterium]
MKKLFYVLFFSLFLLSCTEQECSYLNTPTYCQIADTVYRDYGLSLRRFSNAFPEGGSLCFDPLCLHDGICPESIAVYHTVTDGKHLYVRSNAYLFDGRGHRYQQTVEENGSHYQMAALYKIDLSEGSIEKLVEFSTANGTVTGVSTDGTYLYYVEAKYKIMGEDGDSYGIPMRVPCKGGEAEPFLDGEWSAFAEIYADADHYYVTDDGVFTVIDRKNGSVTTAQIPAVYTDGIIIHHGTVYLYGAAETIPYQINTAFLFSRDALWKWNGETFDCVIPDIDMLVWDTDGVWYTKMMAEEDFVHVGTAESYDGKGMSPYDFIRTTTGALYYHDFSTDAETAYILDNVNVKVEPIGAAGGYIIAACNDMDKLQFSYEYKNLKPEKDGTISIQDAIRGEND